MQWYLSPGCWGWAAYRRFQLYLKSRPIRLPWQWLYRHGKNRRWFLKQFCYPLKIKSLHKKRKLIKIQSFLMMTKIQINCRVLVAKILYLNSLFRIKEHLQGKILTPRIWNFVAIYTMMISMMIYMMNPRSNLIIKRITICRIKRNKSRRIWNIIKS